MEIGTLRPDLNILESFKNLEIHADTKFMNHLTVLQREHPNISAKTGAPAVCAEGAGTQEGRSRVCWVAGAVLGVRDIMTTRCFHGFYVLLFQLPNHPTNLHVST